MCIVTHNRYAESIGFQRVENLCLDQVRILILVNENVVKPRTNLARELRFGNKVAPVQEQVIVVEYLTALFTLHVLAKQLGELVGPVDTPWIAFVQSIQQRLLRIHAARIDSEAGIFPGESARGSREFQFVTYDVHNIRRIATIKNRKARIQSQVVRIVAQQAIGDGVKCARPGQSTRG